MVDIVFGEIEPPSTRRRLEDGDAPARRLDPRGAEPPPLGGRADGGAHDHGPANLRLHDAVLGCLRAAGFSIEMTVHAYSVQDAYIYGFALQETDMASETPDDFAAEAQRQMREYEAVLADYPQPRRGGRRARRDRRATTTRRSSCSGST